MHPARLLVANGGCLPGRCMNGRKPCCCHSTRRRLLRFGQYAAAVRSTAHTRRDGGLRSALAKALVVSRCCSTGAPRRSNACRGPPSAFTTARGKWRDRPIDAILSLPLLQSMRLDLISYYPWGADFCDPRRNSPNRGYRVEPIMIHRHRRTSWANGRRHVDNDRVLLPAGAFCQMLALSLRRIICDLNGR
jgi:hypothetical protein